MSTNQSSSQKADFRLTVVLPVGLAVVSYVLIAASSNDVFAGWSEHQFSTVLNLVSVVQFVYTTALLALFTGALQCWEGKLRLALKTGLVLSPIVIGSFIGAVASTSGADPGPFLSLTAYMLLIVTPILAVLGAFILLTGVTRTLIILPSWWLLGRPAHADMNPAHQTEHLQTGAATALAAQPVAESEKTSRSQTYEFPWTKPTAGLDSLAGMADLKLQLVASLQGFRQYSAKGPVADRNGILLSGPPGNGKTAFAEAIAGELGLPFVKLGCQDLTSKWINESPAVMKDLFRQASEQPCVVFFDEFDGVAMSRGNNNTQAEDRKLVNALLSEIDNARKKHIVLIAATNYVEQIDAAIARDGRFDFRIEIPYPDQEARAAILRDLLRKFSVKAEETTIGHVAELWVRRSVAFIESTVKRLRDSGKGIKGTTATVEDFKLASREASRRASAIPNAGAKLSEIALTSEVRRETDSLVYRLLHWEEIAERGGEPPSGVLLYGPPGTGKTNLVRALARQLEYWHVFEVNASDVLQDPRKFRDIMDLAATHRPAIVFIDEADELLRERTHSNAATATNEILKAMDGMMGKIPEVVFMAATNNPELIDGAALRGGRFAEKIFMGRLTSDDLVTFLEKDFASKKRVQFAADLTPRSLAEKLQEAAPSDALGLLRKAINYTFDQGGEARPVCMADMDKAIQSMQL